MGVIAAGTPIPAAHRGSPHHYALAVSCGYAMLAGLVIARHEPWADEAHSWLLARDASVLDLWARFLHYEGTPGLWQTLLHVLQAFGLPYAGMNFFAGSLGLAGVLLLTRYAPFPRALRWALPFTYYLFYQYAVVARSYALLPVLLFSCAILFRDMERRIWWFTALVSLMAAVSIHGLALSVSIWLAGHIGMFQRWKAVGSGRRSRLPLDAAVWGAASVYALFTALVIRCAWPASDVTFVRHMNTSAVHLLSTTGSTFAEAFTGEWISSLAAVAISVPFLWRNRAFPVFLLSAVMLCVINGVVYSQVWHRGLLFLAWLFAMWVAAQSSKLTWPPAAALVALIAIQGSWTVLTASYDWQYPYSGAKEAARFIQRNHLDRSRFYAVGYACTAVQPYFSANIFANLGSNEGAAFWDWSSRNQSLANIERFSELRPDYVLVGYTGVAEQMIWNQEVRSSGYSLMRHFDGNLFWRTDILEPDAFDLYHRR